MTTFEEKKKLLIDKLVPYTNRFLFPESLIENIKDEGLNDKNFKEIGKEISKELQSYNESLNRIKKLKIELENLKKFDNTLNSHFAWTSSVNRATHNCDSITSKILDRVDKLRYNKILTDNFIDYSSLNIFMKADKNEATKYSGLSTLEKWERL